MKIRKLHIKNYKVFNDLELDFTDANGNTLDKIVLAGVNGCGKTTILELIKKMFDDTLFHRFQKNEDGSINIEIELTTKEIEIGQKRLESYIKKLDSDVFGDNYKSLKELFSKGKYISFLFDFTNKSLKIAELVFVLSLRELGSSISQLLYLPIHDIKMSTITKGEKLEIIHLSSSKDKMKELAIKGIRDEIFKNQDTAPRKTSLPGKTPDKADGLNSVRVPGQWQPMPHGRAESTSAATGRGRRPRETGTTAGCS